MRGILDIFLKSKHLTRYDVAKKTGISEQTLSKANRRDPETYSVKTIVTVAEAVEETPGQVLNELIAIRDSDQLYEATTFKELQQKVKSQEEVFLVKGDFRVFLKEVENSRLSESAELGFYLGSSGMGKTTTWYITRILNLFAPASEREKENLKQEIIALYTTEFIDQTTAKSTLKQLDY